MREFGVGVIGCGAISGNHFHAVHLAEGAVLRGVCDIDGEKLKNAMREHGVPGYTDYRELLSRPEIDAVHICTPHYLHAPMAVDALNAGKHVLCEKPMGMTVEEAKAMAKAAHDSGKTLTICFQNRFNGASLRMKGIIDSGEMGRLLGGSAFVCWDRAGAYYSGCPWRGAWSTEGGSALINQAIHTLDLMRWLAGGLEMMGSTMTAKRLKDEIETEDTCDMLLRDARGGRYLFYCSNCGTGNMPVQMHLTLEKGEMHMNGSYLTIQGPDGVKTEDYSSENVVGKDYWGSSHTHLIQDFYKSLAEGKAPFVTAESALDTMRLVEKAYTGASALRFRP